MVLFVNNADIRCIFAAKKRNKMNDVITFLPKWIVVAAGALAGVLVPTIPFALICLFAVFLDSICAWRLAKRIKRHHPEIPEEQIHDKYESEKAWKMFPTLLIIYGCIVLTHMIDAIIFPFLDMYLPNFVAGGFCLYELVSVLENESSENPRSWARFMQKFLVNKASRHIDGLKEALDGMNGEHQELD